MTDKDVLFEKYLLEKAAAIKRFGYSPLGKAFEKQTVIKKQKEDKRNNLFKTIIGTDEKYRDKVGNALV